MASTRTIAIVGATGKMGSLIARTLAETGVRLVLMANNTGRLNALRQELRQLHGSIVFSCTSAREAAWEADIVILAVPSEVEIPVADDIRDVVTGKIVISVSAGSNRKDDLSVAEQLQRKLTHARIVKTFNTAFISTFVTPSVSCKKAEVFIAGNNGAAVTVVADLAKAAGFNPLVVGDLTTSRALERIGVAQSNYLKANGGTGTAEQEVKGSGPTIL